MSLLFKAHNVKNPGSRGGKAWIDEKGNARYDERPTPKAYDYLAVITMADGSKHYIRPKKTELDEHGQLKGGVEQARKIIERELFGEYGFKDGKFWKQDGIMYSHTVRTNDAGEVVVDAVARHKGYVSFDFRDKSVEAAFPRGLPKTITKYSTTERTDEVPPSKAKIELDAAISPDVPLSIDEIGIHVVPKTLPTTHVALGEPLKDTENPVALADAYLETFLRARKPSQAKTPAGQAKARVERAGQFDDIIGSRRVKELPAWAINKFDSAQELQDALSRDGRPLTTLITLGVWNPESRSKRFREQLVTEFGGFIRRQAQRYGGAFRHTDSYQSFVDIGGEHTWMRDRERELYNLAVATLLHEADTYLANDETTGLNSRFDLKAQQAIKTALQRVSREAIFELGATALEDLGEDDAYHAPKVISPREHFELRHYGPKARAILDTVMADMPVLERKAFEAQLWIDQKDAHPDESEERRHQEAQEKHRLRTGDSGDWRRKMTRNKDSLSTVPSIADKLGNETVKMRDGSYKYLRELSTQHQTFYINKWLETAYKHLETQLRTKNGGLTPDGAIVEKWLRLESKLAHVNRKDVEARLEVPVANMKLKPRSVEHKAQPHPTVQFYRDNHVLARKLGITNNLDFPMVLQNMTAPTSKRAGDQAHSTALTTYHRLHDNLQANPQLIDAAYTEAKTHHAEQTKNGGWVQSAGGVEWVEPEGKGVQALHEAAVKLHQSHGDDAQAITNYARAATSLGKNHPMVKDYDKRFQTLGMDVPTSNDLANWKNHAHAAQRDAANKVHVIEFVKEHRVKKSVGDLFKSFWGCVDAFTQLSEAFV